MCNAHRRRGCANSMILNIDEFRPEFEISGIQILDLLGRHLWLYFSQSPSYTRTAYQIFIHYFQLCAVTAVSFDIIVNRLTVSLLALSVLTDIFKFEIFYIPIIIYLV